MYPLEDNTNLSEKPGYPAVVSYLFGIHLIAIIHGRRQH